MVTILFVDITKIFLSKNKGIADISLKFLGEMFKARDKSKVHYKEWLTKCLSNLIMYLDTIKPRLFSDKDLNKALPIGTMCFDFIFDKEVNREQM